MEYEIVDKPPFSGRLKWRGLFDSLPLNKAVAFRYLDKKQAKVTGSTIQGSLRKGRVDYSVHCRIISDGDEFLLYVWKEVKDGS